MERHLNRLDLVTVMYTDRPDNSSNQHEMEGYNSQKCGPGDTTRVITFSCLQHFYARIWAKQAHFKQSYHLFKTVTCPLETIRKIMVIQARLETWNVQLWRLRISSICK